MQKAAPTTPPKPRTLKEIDADIESNTWAQNALIDIRKQLDKERKDALRRVTFAGLPPPLLEMLVKAEETMATPDGEYQLAVELGKWREETIAAVSANKVVTYATTSAGFAGAGVLPISMTYQIVS